MSRGHPLVELVAVNPEGIGKLITTIFPFEL